VGEIFVRDCLRDTGARLTGNEVTETQRGNEPIGEGKNGRNTLMSPQIASQRAAATREELVLDGTTPPPCPLCLEPD
jgi:hypothetical protein